MEHARWDLEHRYLDESRVEANDLRDGVERSDELAACAELQCATLVEHAAIEVGPVLLGVLSRRSA